MNGSFERNDTSGSSETPKKRLTREIPIQGFIGASQGGDIK